MFFMGKLQKLRKHISDSRIDSTEYKYKKVLSVIYLMQKKNI